MHSQKGKPPSRPLNRATPEITPTSLSQERNASAALRPQISAATAYRSYVDQAIGINFGGYPKLIDDCLNRSLVTMQALTGTGNRTVRLDAAPSVIQPAIVGVDSAKATGAYQVTTTLNVAMDGSLDLVIAASPGITWSVLLLTQKGKQ